MSATYHIPVMFAETLDLLVADPAGLYVDATLGGGGHAAGIVERLSAGGRLHAFDADPGAIANARTRFAGRSDVTIRQAYFSEAVAMLETEGAELSGVLLDLGVSSRQLDSDQIGLSYRQEMPLDMRFDPASDRRTARELINEESAGDIATLLRRYGEEPAAWKIAQEIVHARRARPIATTTELRAIIEAVIPGRFLVKTLSRVFQALRIAVNDELGELERALDGFIPLLVPGGRFAILTYHSLEDRLVKEKFREEERDCICPPDVPICRCEKQRRLRILTRKPRVPSEAEVAANPRARSAKLRVAERVAGRTARG